ncbi:MAG: radical SAM protein [Terracoccus sp.]
MTSTGSGGDRGVSAVEPGSAPLPSASAWTAAAVLDGGTQDCGSGLLLSLTVAMRRIGAGEVLLLHTAERSVLVDLPAWARLAGHGLIDVRADDERRGPWHLAIRRGAPAVTTRPAEKDAAATAAGAGLGFSRGEATPLGSRLWLYSNFHCNLACSYCCAESSPRAAPRLMPVDLAARAVDEFVTLGGQEVLVTGGEPFLHPDLGNLVAAVHQRVPVTILTNAMVFERGARRRTLESMDRDAVTLQVSLDSAGPTIHDDNRGAGSHARALSGIRLARGLDFRVKIAATVTASDLESVPALNGFLDELDVPAEDRLVRPVAAEGFADDGQHISLDTVEPEPTLTVDGAWWHPVAVTSGALRVADHPLPLAEVYDVIRDVISFQAASSSEGREVFRCT